MERLSVWLMPLSEEKINTKQQQLQEYKKKKKKKKQAR